MTTKIGTSNMGCDAVQAMRKVVVARRVYDLFCEHNADTPTLDRCMRLLDSALNAERDAMEAYLATPMMVAARTKPDTRRDTMDHPNYNIHYPDHPNAAACACGGIMYWHAPVEGGGCEDCPCPEFTPVTPNIGGTQ